MRKQKPSDRRRAATREIEKQLHRNSVTFQKIYNNGSTTWILEIIDNIQHIIDNIIRVANAHGLRRTEMRVDEGRLKISFVT